MSFFVTLQVFKKRDLNNKRELCKTMQKNYFSDSLMKGWNSPVYRNIT